MHLLYPNSPLHPREPDEQFAAEVEAVRGVGFEASLFSLEDFQTGVADEYEGLVSAMARSGARATIDLKS